MRYQYATTCTTYEVGERRIASFGIALVETHHDGSTILETFADLSQSREAVEKLVHLCNELQPDPIHLADIVNDFLADPF